MFISLATALRRRDRQSESGLTILEALVAIIMIAIVGAMITPPIILAVATRLQNQRTQQAYQLAQGEVDRVRGLVDNGEHTPDNLPAAIGNGPLDGIDPPTGAIDGLQSVNGDEDSYQGDAIAANAALPVDVTGDGNANFLVQTFRTNGVTSASEAGGLNRPTSFSVAVRVYAVLDDLDEVPWAELETDEASIRFTSGDSDQRTNPLAVLYSNINWSDTSDSLCEFQRPNGGCEGP